jgi:hypothetical protein
MHNQVESLKNIVDGYSCMEDVNAARLRSDNIKWSASKIVPETYGDNINLNINHTLDLSSVLLAAENRIIPILEHRSTIAGIITDAEVIESDGLDGIYDD